MNELNSENLKDVSSLTAAFPKSWFSDLFFGTVLDKEGYKIEIRTKEQGHNTPHCHISYQGRDISVSLVDCSVLAGNMKKKNQNRAIEFVKSNLEYFKIYWNSYHEIIIPVENEGE